MTIKQWIALIFRGRPQPVVEPPIAHAADQPPRPRCPGCQRAILQNIAPPKNPAGDFACCLCCGHVAILTADTCDGSLALRSASDAELRRVKRGLGAQWEQIEQRQRAWRDHLRRRINLQAMTPRGLN